MQLPESYAEAYFARHILGRTIEPFLLQFDLPLTLVTATRQAPATSEPS